jgi:hypothetical protein
MPWQCHNDVKMGRKRRVKMILKGNFGGKVRHGAMKRRYSVANDENSERLGRNASIFFQANGKVREAVKRRMILVKS